MFQPVDIVEKIRIKADESATSAMGQKWNHAFCVRLWPKASEAGTAEIVRWLKQNIEHGGWGIYKNDQRVIGIRDPNDAMAFKMRWR